MKYLFQILLIAAVIVSTHELRGNSGIREVKITSKFDQTAQPAMIMAASGNDARPLLVALHTWSCSYKSDSRGFVQLCKERNWHLIYPNFRGPNWNPDACGSELVVSDIEDAVDYMCRNFNVDRKRIYLFGGSGGGHCTLLIAGRRPDLFCAVSAWCPISDIARWHKDSKKLKNSYWKHIEISCGGNPEESDNALKEARKRSPLTWLPNAVDKVAVDISTGIHDGHTGSVPVGHAIRAYNILADEKDRISEEDIAFIEKNRAIPAHLKFLPGDPAYGKHKVYLRKVSRQVRLTIFEGGHNILPAVGGEWLSRQSAGNSPDFNTGAAGDSRSLELSK